MDGEPRFFPAPRHLRAWLEEHHLEATELWVGFWKKASGEPSITWPESVDEALCFGWIDGIRRSIDERRYKIRFTPRRRTSRWSRVNVERVAALEAEGRMQPAGREAFAARSDDEGYSYEQRQEAVLAPELLAELQRDEAAWADYSSRPPGYRRTVAYWVMSAKREATRRRRLATLIESSAAGRKVPPLDR